MSIFSRNKNFVSLGVVYVAVLGMFLAACGDDSSSPAGNEALPTSSSNETFVGSVNGVAQKGPFGEGSSVVVQEVDEISLAQTGKSFSGKVINDRGDFSIENVSLDHPYVLLEVNGYYRNEVTGEKSNDSIFMKALVDVRTPSKVNINLLTHLEYERVKTLVEQNSMSIEDAKRQANRELFAAFGVDVDYVKVENLDIFGTGEGNAMLLAINVLLLGNESDADFMARLVSIGQDFAEDGVWNDSLLMTKIADFACETSLSGKLADIRQNIESWKIADVPEFETYVDRFWQNLYGLGECKFENRYVRSKRAKNLPGGAYSDTAFLCTGPSVTGWILYSSFIAPQFGDYTEQLGECTAENDGEIKDATETTFRAKRVHHYRCESGSWVEGDVRLTCDTAGVQIGDFCRKTVTPNYLEIYPNIWAQPHEYVFVYVGNNNWADVDDPKNVTRECTAENEGDKEKIVFGRDSDLVTRYYKCAGAEWSKVDEPTFYDCTDSISTSGTCSIEIDGKMVYYKYDEETILVNGSWMKGSWVKSGYDPELGFCPMTYTKYYVLCGEGSEFDCEVDEYNQPKLLESGWVNYYCSAAQWKQSNLVPNQYTDPRKEGLTDMEYDVLDLPKDAEVGDRAGGLLEICWYDQELETVNGKDVYDYCLSRNYYRYRENGSWTLETRAEYESYSYGSVCDVETFGEKKISQPSGEKPGAIYQCVSGYSKIVEYIFNRYEKK